jgi:hypothetical protein
MNPPGLFRPLASLAAASHSAIGEISIYRWQESDWSISAKQMGLKDWSHIGVIHPEDLPSVIEGTP